MMNPKVHELLISKDTVILTALKQMDDIKRKLLIVLDGNQYYGLLSIGDIQRAIIKNNDFHNSIYSIMRNDYIIAQKKTAIDDVKKMMLQIRSEFMPVVDDENNLEDVYFWDDLFGNKRITPSVQYDLPTVIMAGGMGTRLKPLTNIIPKPLLPIGEKTILEEIMDRFIDLGSNRFNISINYKADTIEHYFRKNEKYHIEFFKEDKPLGTAGSLFLIKDKLHSTFFVSNCDILIDADYSEILKYHEENCNEITIVSAIKHYPIPYGILKTGLKGILKELQEKPELTFQINSGMYILEPHLLNEIPENKFFHITHLIESIQKRKGRVGVFPISQGSWSDIGTWNDYLKAIKK